MDSKKLQQLQQANSHLAPQTKPPTFHQHGDFRPSRSPVFQNYPQYQSLASNFAQINMTHTPHDPQQQQQQQQQLHGKSFQQQQQSNAQLGYHEQIYQSTNAGAGGGGNGVEKQQQQQQQQQIYQHQTARNQFPNVHSHVHSASRLQQQFQALQQEKIQEQMRTQNEALALQQQTFAMRQQMNPPIPSSYPSQTSSMSNMSSVNNVPAQLQQQLQLQHRTLPPSSLNLTNQFQPAQGPLKLSNVLQTQQQQQQQLQMSQQMMQSQRQMMHQQQLQQQQAIYQQQMQMQSKIQQHQQHQQQQQQNNQLITPSDNTVPIIQQNIPGQVTNQSVQTQLSGNSGMKNVKSPETPQSTPSTPSTPLSPAHSLLERKKGEPVHTLKSPVTKRAPTAPVTFSGWLYKQGSEGLKVWRKRWFVLSEYCLFYYKGPEEEKVLGSVLLPSYRISACLPDDKANRKFAFKCEHTNMRTYVLAAETPETMVQWVRSLTMASMMQGSSGSESQPSISSSFNPSGGDNSDSGIHTFQSQQSKLAGIPQGPVTPASDNGGQHHQPLYANAPPKPRRVTDGGYSSPSPENAMDPYEIQQRQQRMHQQLKTPLAQDPIYDARYKQAAQITAARQNAKTPDPILSMRMQNMRLEQNKSPSALKSQQMMTGSYPSYNPEQQQMRSQAEQEQYMQKMILHQQQLQQQQKYLANTIPMSYNQERRTPDTYGPQRPNQERRTFGDYEDIYNLTNSTKQHSQQHPMLPQMNQTQPTQDAGTYRRPMSPTKYDGNIQIPPMPTRYTPNFLEQQTMAQQQQQQQHQANVNMRPKPISSVARPHSADFLEYEARNPVTTRMKAEPAQAPRPKSSLDINRAQDNVYYSEASYAEKMRQSALYLQKQSNTMPGKGKIDYQEPFHRPEDVINHSAMNTQTLQREIEMVRANRYDITDDIQGSASVPRMHRPNMGNKSFSLSQQEQFLRSASARLSKKEDDPNHRDGERKREESMKRLLEWKQRMLQSPLTRKGPQLSLAPIGQPPMNLQHPPKSPMTVQGQYPQYNQQLEHQQSNHVLQRSRSDTHANTAYNSYSSDDEVTSVSVRNNRNVPKPPLTVKPDPNDTLNRSINQVNGGNSNSLYYYDSYSKPDLQASSNSLYMNGQQQQHLLQEPAQHQYAVVKKSGSKRDIRENLERENSAIIKNLNMSAGDLLNRTHEELILLLIQLRRQNCTTARAIEQCCTDIHDVQNRIRTAEGNARAESAAHLEKLKQQLSELEKQYQKSKPLVNLVDNMVKLGSLYRGGNHRGYPNETTTLDRLEFNQRIQERRLLQEEQRQWERMSPNQTELQSKVQQLYKLDQLLQEESGTLQNLQRDKEDLERALYALRSKIQNENAPAVAVEAARRQQHALEMELSRVHQLLAENSKKLEQTVNCNSRLEQELLVLRQKLQASRDSKNVQSSSGLGHDGGAGSGATAVLESELRRVQQLVGDMQRQRQELSQAVRQLTDNSNSIYQEMNKNASHIKKHRTSSTSWMETDLDDQMKKDMSNYSMDSIDQTTPLYIDTNSTLNSQNIINCSSSSKLSDYEISKLMNGKMPNGYSDEIIDSLGLESDDLLESSAFSNLSSQEKQEIKTVRIVKRESERRQRDRERSGIFPAQNLDQVMEEEAQLFNNAINSDAYNAYQRSKSLPRTYLETHEVYSQQSVNPQQIQQQYQLQTKYNDYYNSVNVNNNYPLPMIDRTADLYSDSSASQLPQSTEKNMQYSNYYSQPPAPQNPPSNLSGMKHNTESIQSLTKTFGELSPVFQSEAARQIIIEMSGNSDNDNNNPKVSNANKQRRAVPKEKRRHFTAPHHVNAKTVQTIQSENDMNKNNINWRARDDLDMEVALRPRINAPDVVRSALGPREKISTHTIDNLFGAPNKIVIPERYIPEQTPELSPEEKKRRQEKVEVIKKMLSETTPSMTANDNAMPPSQISAEKKQREHLLQLNQILAQQVMQMSKIVAEKAMAVLPSNVSQLGDDERDQSPIDPLPLYQQRDNYFA